MTQRELAAPPWPVPPAYPAGRYQSAVAGAVAHRRALLDVDTAAAQEVHMAVTHILGDTVEAELAPWEGDAAR